MSARYQKLVLWAYNTKLFSDCLNELLKDFTLAEVAEIVGVTPSCIKSWANGHYSDGFNHPSMSNFLVVCDQLDLDPREFFVQEDC